MWISSDRETGGIQLEVGPLKRLQGQKAVVTGAASGLGRQISLALARRGWKVGIVDINDAGSVETLEMVERAGGSGEVFHADVRKPGAVGEMAEHFFNAWGGVDALFNNAGIAVAGLMGDIPLEDWRKQVDSNLWSVIYGCHEFVPRMKAQGSGHIINTASAAGIISLAEMGPYNICKAGVISLSETLRVELAPHNIRVTAVCPFFFDTHLLDDLCYTDGFQQDFANTAFRHSRMSAREVAERVLRAVEKNKLYVLPQLSSRAFAVLKRLSPTTFYGVQAGLNRVGIARPLLMRAARWGLL